jgi:hypothetical protein
MPNEYSVAVLLPTRGRTDSLTRSVTSLVERATDLSRVQILFGFDNDDTVGLEHFEDVIQPFLDDQEVDYEAQVFDSMGYAGLNRYYNHLALSAEADWLFVWNDDAVMDSSNWDQVIADCTGEFKILKVHTHNEHPYSIFPIVPKTWLDVQGVLSRHQMIDAEISQIAYMLDLIKIVDITVTHDQSELTGKQDATSQQKNRFEGNPNDPRDFHYRDIVLRRHADCDQLMTYMQSQNLDTSFYQGVVAHTRDPWEKLKENDINQHMFTFTQRL